MDADEEAGRTGSRRAPRRLPDFLIIGAMRAGTTTLARCVGEHPAIHMPAKKEIHFFDWNWDRGIDWYRDQFSEAAPGAVTGEATPIYVVYREAMERIRSALPGVKLIVALRNPADRAYSHYWYNRMLEFEPLEFEAALEAEPLRETGVTDRRTFDYVERGRYLPQLKRVCELFPREALHVMLFEDLISDPAATYAAAFRFLGVDDSFAPPSMRESLNSYAEYRSKLVQKVGRSLPPALSRAVRRLNRRETRYPRMEAGVRARLSDRFAEDNAALSAWLGRDLGPWTAERQSARAE